MDNRELINIPKVQDEHGNLTLIDNADPLFQEAGVRDLRRSRRREEGRHAFRVQQEISDSFGVLLKC
jgi:predicted metalloprotease